MFDREQEPDKQAASSSHTDAQPAQDPQAERFRGGILPAVSQQPVAREGGRTASEQAYEAGAQTPKPQAQRNAAAETQQVLKYIQTQAKTRAAEPKHISKDSNLYKRLSTHYMKDYLANPNPQAGKAVTEKIGEQTSAEDAAKSDDYWEKSAPAWNEHKVPQALKLLSPNAPDSMGAATKIMNQENRQHLPYLDVPQMVGNPNTDTGADADVHGGGKNISQLMHWGTGVKYADQDPQSMRDMFLAYEYYHLEGFDKFGEDSINDMISEDAGRIMGRQLQAGEINQENLQQKLDAGFDESRAWVGKMIKMRQGELDAVITSKEPVASEMWYGEIPGAVQHWGPTTIQMELESGKTVEDVQASSLVQHFIDIYALIFYSDIWQKEHGKIKLSNFQESILAGKYNKVFEKSVKNQPLTGKEKMDAYMDAKAPWVPGFIRDGIRKVGGSRLGLEDDKEGAQHE
ncbi:MAG TPA: hypothetical protein VFQ53_25480 [Kofleriaceae bacterium]|nr:hypothetical protein [Kofleriaceae bacterium]